MSAQAPVVHLRDIAPRARGFAAWERQRNKKEVHWAIELFAEALGVFFYTYSGLGSATAWTVGGILNQPTISSLEQIGFAYAFGILFAIATCSATSGGHFNPCFTVCYIIYKKFPPWKGARYILAQLVGAYIASALVYAQYKVVLDLCIETMKGNGTFETLMFTPSGPGGIFSLQLFPGQTLARVFLNEWTSCTFIAIVVWASIDPTNYMVPPVFSPVIVALAYAAVIWGFATPNVALNTARDVGGRLWSITVYGTAAAGGKYAAIAALTNIPATVFGVFLYETFLTDSDRVVPPATLEFINVYTNHRRLRREKNESRRQSRVTSMVELDVSNIEMQRSSTKGGSTKPSLSGYENENSTEVIYDIPRSNS